MQSRPIHTATSSFQELCEHYDLPFTVVRKDGETYRMGHAPRDRAVMAGSSHVCSKKFKGDVIQKWVRDAYPDEQITFLIGIEKNEGHRTARFTKPASDTNEYEYPLVDMGWDRAACVAYLDRREIEVGKSSCVYCPFMSEEEISEMRFDPEAWQTIKLVEQRFAGEQQEHQAWIDAGKPLNKGGRCNAGHWRKDPWAEGQRLFVRKKNGRQLSVDEWEQYFKNGRRLPEEQEAAHTGSAHFDFGGITDDRC